MYEQKLFHKMSICFRRLDEDVLNFFVSDAPEYQGMKTYKLNFMHSMILKQTVIVKLSVILILRLSVWC